MEEPLISVQNVELALDIRERNPGIFSIHLTDRNYVFEWVPNPDQDQKVLLEKNIPLKVAVPLKRIAQIQVMHAIRENQPVSCLIMKLKTNAALPRFIFNDFGDLIVDHLMELLVFKKLIQRDEFRSRIFHPIDQSLPEDSLDTDEEDTNIKPQDVVGIAAHNQILKRLRFSPNSTRKSFSHVTRADFEAAKASNLADIKKSIFENGLDDAARPYVWPVLFGVIPPNSEDIEEVLDTKMIDYLNIRRQWELLTETQREHSKLWQDMERVIENDVKRNDRKYDAFKDNDSPNLLLLKRVLTTYAFYNRDTGYVQGMNDLLSPLIMLFIVSWEENVAIFYDGSKRSMDQAEAFLFWNFVGMMELTHHERLFVDLAAHQAFVLERSAKIANEVHKPLEMLLSSKELSDLSFMFKPMLLMYKRAFKDGLRRLWDSIFTAASPSCYIRFIGAAILILLFPKLMLHTDQTLGEVMSFAEGFFGEVDVESVMALASILINRMEKAGKVREYVYEEIPSNSHHKNYVSKYLNFLI